MVDGSHAMNHSIRFRQFFRQAPRGEYGPEIIDDVTLDLLE